MLSSVPIALFVTGHAVLGTTAAVAPLPALITEADLITVGTVTRTRSFWQEGRILTRATLAVEEILAGPTAPAAIEIDSLGGVVDGIGQQVAGAVHLRPGDRVVLFLQRRPAAFVVLEMAQGAFWLDGAADSERLSRRSFGLHILTREATEPWPTRLDDLRLRIRELRREH